MAPERGKPVEWLQVMLSPGELDAIKEWRFRNMIPTRAAAVRELLRRGLLSSEASKPPQNASTDDYGMLLQEAE